MSAIPNLGVVSNALMFGHGNGQLKGSNTEFMFRNNADTGYLELYVADATNTNGAVNLGQLNLKLDASKVVTDINATAGNVPDAPTTLAAINSAVANLVDSSPAALDTLNELAAALGDDANFATTVNNAIAAKQDALTAGTGIDITGSTISVDADATEITADATGHTYAIGSTVDAQLSNIDTAISSTDSDVVDLVTLSGVAANATDLGTFTGDTISDNVTVKPALQALETKIEQVETSAMSNMCRIEEFTYTDGATFNIDTTSIPSGKRIEAVIVKIDTAFNDIAATMSIGDGTTADRFMASDDINLAYTKSQIEYPMDKLTADTTIVATMSAGTSTQGAGVIMVKYC